MRCLSFITILIAVALPLRAASAAEKSGRADAARGDAAREASSGDYVLQPLDTIRIQINQEPDLSRELRISQEGSVHLPYIGRLDLRTKTVRQAEEMIRKAYDADYLVNPQVNLSVIKYATRTVQVFGMVANPGVVTFPEEEGLTLMKAISMAGSFTRLANKKFVTLKRLQPDGTYQTYTINADKLTQGESAEDWPLQPDDVITVPERII